MTTNSAIHPVDEYVGKRVRLQRRALGLSQQELAKTLGITFQQVQKYELGANRISCSKLYEISRRLQVEVTYFFDGFTGPVGIEDPVPSNPEASVQEFLATAEGPELVKCFPRISTAKLRRRFLDLARALAEEQGES